MWFFKMFSLKNTFKEYYTKKIDLIMMVIFNIVYIELLYSVFVKNVTVFNKPTKNFKNKFYNGIFSNTALTDTQNIFYIKLTNFNNSINENTIYYLLFKKYNIPKKYYLGGKHYGTVYIKPKKYTY